MKGLEITLASFEEALELQDAVSEALMDKGIELSPELLSGEIDASILKAILSLVKNKRLRSALFACAERVLYNKERVNMEFFESVKNRALYYPIMIEVLKANIGPLLESLTGLLGELKETSPAPSLK